MFLVSTNFSIHSYLVTRVKTEKQKYYHRDRDVSVILYYLLFVLIQQSTVTFFFYSIRNYSAMTSDIRTKDNP